MNAISKDGPFPRSPLRTEQKVRSLTAQDLGVAIGAAGTPSATLPSSERIMDDDEKLVAVRELLKDYGGVILVGPPGTSKTWYAAQIAAKLADQDPDRIRFIQFHPSYQYEDFVVGYVPKKNGHGFTLRDKHLLEMSELASKSDSYCVIVIDELNRGDPGRVFGEALTYIERTKRGLRFHLSYGQECSIPDKLVILATMNPLDRGVDEVDAAFERRLAKIPMDPDERILKQFLDSSGMDSALQSRVLRFFRTALATAKQNPYARIGHTYFYGMRTEEDLRRLWRHQLRFVFEKAYRLDPEGLKEIQRAWDQIFGRTEIPASETPDGTGEKPAADTPIAAVPAIPNDSAEPTSKGQ